MWCCFIRSQQSNETGCPSSSKGAWSQGCHHACLQRIGTRYYKRLSTILKRKFQSISSEVVVVSGPSHAGGNHCTRYHLDYGSLKDLKRPSTSKIFSNHYFRLYTNTDVISWKPLVLLNIIAVGAGALHGLDLWQCQGGYHCPWLGWNHLSRCRSWANPDL